LLHIALSASKGLEWFVVFRRSLRIGRKLGG